MKITIEVVGDGLRVTSDAQGDEEVLLHPSDTPREQRFGYVNQVLATVSDELAHTYVVDDYS